MNSTLPDAIECPSCEDPVPLADLERHLRGSHGFPRSTAARVAAEERRALAGAQRHEPTQERVKAPPEPGNLASEAPLPAQAKKSHRADPQSCLTCVRVGGKCRRHGGRIRSTSYRGMGEAGAFAIAVREFKRSLVMEALRTTGGHRTQAAKLLGVRIAYFFKLLRNLGIESAAPSAVAEPGVNRTSAGGA